jgi:hypothetical protein
MNDELQLIERLNGVRAILHTQPELADVILLGMIEEAERKVAQFEEYAEQHEGFEFYGS